MTLNAQELLTRVRERIHDRNGLTFDDNEVLRVADDSLRQVFTALRTHGDSPLLDTLDVDTSALTKPETQVYQYEPPEYVGDIQMVEGRQTNALTRQIPRSSLEQKDVSRGTFAGYGQEWIYGPRGTIQVRGSLESFLGLRIWYVRRIPPMFWTVTASGSTTTIVPGTTKGALKSRDAIYVGAQFEATAGSNLGQVRRCTAFVSGTLTTEAWPSSTSGGTFSMVLPLVDEYSEYLTSLVVLKLMRRQGSAEEQAAMAGEVAMLQQEFESGIARPSSGEPPRLFNSRRSS